MVGVVVGGDPAKRLAQYAPEGWADMVHLVSATSDYHDAVDARLGTLELDAHYEAKCMEHLVPGDLLWVVGIRQTQATAARPAVVRPGTPAPTWITGDSLVADLPERADMVFTCPPYMDLEVYSKDPADISNMNAAEFTAAYRRIIHRACERLADDRFAAIVVGDVRDKRGHYRDFVSETIRAFRDAGLAFYNDAIVIDPVGTLRLRAGKAFKASRKLGTTHQRLLVFVKGGAKRATQAVGPVDMGEDQADA